MSGLFAHAKDGLRPSFPPLEGGQGGVLSPMSGGQGVDTPLEGGRGGSSPVTPMTTGGHGG